MIGRLVEHGLIFRTKKGTYEFTAPQFHEFVTRRLQSPDSAHTDNLTC